MAKWSVELRKAALIAASSAVMAGYVAAEEVVEVSGRIKAVGAKYPQAEVFRLIDDTSFFFSKPGGFHADLDLNGHALEIYGGGNSINLDGSIRGNGTFFCDVRVHLRLTGE